ncbi:MAG: hypothetical protein ACKOZX_02455, partial [Gammaproteobacteria bacterium]
GIDVVVTILSLQVAYPRKHTAPSVPSESMTRFRLRIRVPATARARTIRRILAMTVRACIVGLQVTRWRGIRWRTTI